MAIKIHWNSVHQTKCPRHSTVTMFTDWMEWNEKKLNIKHSVYLRGTINEERQLCVSFWYFYFMFCFVFVVALFCSLSHYMENEMLFQFCSLQVILSDNFFKWNKIYMLNCHFSFFFEWSPAQVEISYLLFPFLFMQKPGNMKYNFRLWRPNLAVEHKYYDSTMENPLSWQSKAILWTMVQLKRYFESLYLKNIICFESQFYNDESMIRCTKEAHKKLSHKNFGIALICCLNTLKMHTLQKLHTQF